MDLKRLEELFHASCDLQPAERSTFLNRELGESPADSELRAKLEAMLRIADADDATLPRPEIAATTTSAPPRNEASTHGLTALDAGTELGRYRLLELLGEGGFGVVYRAEQLRPMQREVALKVLKVGMDTREVVARFEAERQALALMDHRSIAQVLDGGVTDGGRPFFVMELVRGEPVTIFCRARELDLRRRLELFVEICEAVQHAHQKGVVHRDLKPSNILVCDPDSGTATDSGQGTRSVPKVIDFGIAKALHGRLTDQTLHSAAYRMLGTPAYMSPEQAVGEVDVDTRADVYSLGVLLYELLTGTTPFAAGGPASSDGSDVGLAEIERRIREDEPLKPSRQAGPREFGRRLRGDLDWIVLKALEKDRERRYAAASELAEDVRRHLRDEPVAAGPPSTAYRLRKFLRRNRAQSVLAALLLLAILGGALGTVAGLLEASRQRDAARVETRRAEAATDFLVQTLALADPEVALKPDLSVRTLLDRAAARANETLAGQPEAEARVRSTLGRAYESLGEHKLAERQLRDAVELSDRHGGLAPREIYDTLWTLTHVLHRLERPDAREASHRARQVAHDIVRADHSELASVLDEFIVQLRSGVHHPDPTPIDRAHELLADASELARGQLASDDALWPLLADGCMDAGFSLWFTPHESRSDEFFRCALDIRKRVLPHSHPDVGESAGMLAGVLNRSGRAAEAEEMLRQVLADMEEVFEPDNFQVAFTRAMLGENLSAQGRFAEAEPLLVESHAVMLQITDDPATVFPIDSFGRLIHLYDAWDRPQRAEPYRRALAEIGARSSWPVPWPFVRWVMAGRYAELVPILDRLDTLCGGVAFGASEGELSSEDLAPVVEELETATRDLDRSDPRTAVVGRMLVAWSNSAKAGDPVRPRLAELALSLTSTWQHELPLDGAEAEVWAAVGATGEEREAHLDVAKAYLERLRSWDQVSGGESAQHLGDSWYVANAKIRIARGLMELGLEGEARQLVAAAMETLRVQLGERNRDFQSAERLLARLESGRDVTTSSAATPLTD
ncbi:MAG: protein kinase [Thermoanaerobaculia bacterium]|nr:protein kinase [Thermoanaerobaculia bacterium]